MHVSKKEKTLLIDKKFIEFNISTLENNSRKIRYESSGIGVILSDYEWEEEAFVHSLNLAKVREQHPDEADLEKVLVSHFWYNINDRLKNPFIRYEGEIEGHSLEFIQGSAKEFHQLMHWFILTERGLTPDIIKIKAASPEDGSFVSFEEGAPDTLWHYPILERNKEDEMQPACLLKSDYYSVRLDRLVDLALKGHTPYGYRYANNGEDCDCFSNYFVEPLVIEYDIDEILNVPAREKMAARHELAQWLVERGQNPADYGLTWEKIV
jgi:hypothetical protein